MLGACWRAPVEKAVNAPYFDARHTRTWPLKNTGLFNGRCPKRHDLAGISARKTNGKIPDHLSAVGDWVVAAMSAVARAAEG